jgi:transcriptional regulator with XRE-family HTH domain
VGKPQREVDPFRDELRLQREALGRRIRELRREHGWSQEEFADRAHIHRTFAGSLERGEKNCSFHALILIAQCFSLTVSDLLLGLEEGKSAPGQRSRKLPAARDALERSRILKEVSALERAAKTLREIAMTGSQPDDAKRKARK